MTLQKLFFNLYFMLLISCLAISSGFVRECNGQGIPPSESGAKTRVMLLQERVTALDLEKTRMDTVLLNLNSSMLELETRRDELLEIQDQLGVSSNAYPEIVKTLQSQKVQLAIDLAGLDARRQFLSDASAKTQSEDLNEILAPLKEVLLLEQTALDQANQFYKQGNVSIEHVGDAKRRLLLARIRLAEAKRGLSGGTNIREKLLESSLERAEKRARLDQVEQILDKLTDSRSRFESSIRSDRLLAARLKSLDEAKTALQETEAKLNRARQQLQELDPNHAEDQH